MKEEQIFQIAIDGPSGAGKSTIAQQVAKLLGIDYIDTGAMYRAIGYKILERKINLDHTEEVIDLLGKTDIDFSKGNIILDGEIVNDQIRTPEVTKMASMCSALPEVRAMLVALQRKMGQAKSVVMDGRDIGTNVLTDARYKFFMTASAQERAERRYEELVAKGQNVNFDAVLADIIKRDHDDSTRALNPLKRAEDAIELDTTGMSITEVTEKIIKEIRKNGNC
ncbi:(d)CMP kinase [Clostridium aminobutyricum]|uniref:Cytidylate kinase n=1 Tax=Clostridium aminobutyricum TaxID=33953 RepID=A0A939D804_CLOAM|nr:(d)CMP kinase [Clostridium aminobutyricum]MBN7772806.1 (d)CMP kinase [Clostridium aminobutyricum]